MSETALPARAPARTLEEDWSEILRPGVEVDLEVYGEHMSGRLIDASGDTIRLRIPPAQQVSALRLSTAHGQAVVSLDGGAVHLPVSCWTSGDVVRLQVIGPIAFRQRRVHTRHLLRLPVTVAWNPGGVGVWKRVVSETVDVSTGGVRVAFAREVWPDPGTAAQVVLQMAAGPRQSEASVLGVAADYGLRLRFTDPAPEFLAAIGSALT